ncbi:hypothetical protein H1R20_g15320, partial [Candolleomyces eurysporus]
MVSSTSTSASTWTSPPPVKNPYKAEQALEDIPGLQYALKLFLESKMVESEDYCNKSDEKKERLYFATGFSLIQCVKGLMSYEDEDLLAALNHAKHGNQIASQHRKKQALLGSIVSVIASSSSVGWIKSMTPVERHAELVYAESLFEKALLGIVYSGDWLAFIKEALNMRTTISTYKHLLAYLQSADAEAEAQGLGPIDTSIDPHFRSGVYLGNGMANIVLSLMPGKLMTIVEMFGYHGDREVGLELLMKAGGWVTQEGEKEGADPAPLDATTEGLRRPICDLCLLMFHLVISSFTFTGVNIPLASKILEYNLERYPDSVFFLFGAGRLGLIKGQPHQAIAHYKKAMQVQSQYKSLHHISWWEIAVAELALGRVGGGGAGAGGKEEQEEEEGSGLWWRKMHKEATWSRAIYGYGLGVCLSEEALELGQASPSQPEKKGEDKEREKKRKQLRDEAASLMKKVPDLRQRIAGKSIPLEKLVARKARKFTSQKNHLTLGALELSYIFQAIAHAPRSVLLTKMLPQIRNYELGRLLACQGKVEDAKHEFELVLSGRYLEVGASGKKGKYSLENALHVRTHAASEALKAGKRL